MSRKQVLQLVEDKGIAPAPRRSISDEIGTDRSELHSLHAAVPYQWGIRPELADLCLRRYTERGAIVFDPFCGRGSTVLQSALLGRIGFGSDQNPLATLVTQAKLFPIGLDEVVIGLHLVPFQRPVEMGPYREIFYPFYHPDTYREIMNLRFHLLGKSDRFSSFVRLLALSRLHGHMPGHLSAYTSHQFALAPEKQAQLNLRRREKPDYRAVAPRLIRRAAQVLQDGVGTAFHQAAKHGGIRLSDPRRLNWLKSDSIDAVITSGADLSGGRPASEQWLGSWFVGFEEEDFITPPSHPSESDLARLYSDVLGELLRVTRVGGSVSIVAPEIIIDGVEVPLDEVISDIARNLEKRSAHDRPSYDRSGKMFRTEEVLVYSDDEMSSSHHLSNGEIGSTDLRESSLSMGNYSDLQPQSQAQSGFHGFTKPARSVPRLNRIVTLRVLRRNRP